MEIHVTLVTFAEIFCSVFRPLVRLGKQHAVRVLFVDMPAKPFEKIMCPRKIFAVGPLFLIEVGHRIET